MKKISCFLIAIVIGIMVAFGAVACAPKPPVEVDAGFYTIKEAYELGLLKKSDLQTIAYYNTAYYNGDGLQYPETLDSAIEERIKEEEAERLRNLGYPYARAKGIKILYFYGEYSGNYVIRMRNDYQFPPLDIRYDIETIGGFMFRFFAYDTYAVWRAEKTIIY